MTSFTADELFSSIDVNNDGVITRQEFNSALGRGPVGALGGSIKAGVSSPASGGIYRSVSSPMIGSPGMPFRTVGATGAYSPSVPVIAPMSPTLVDQRTVLPVSVPGQELVVVQQPALQQVQQVPVPQVQQVTSVATPVTTVAAPTTTVKSPVTTVLPPVSQTIVKPPVNIPYLVQEKVIDRQLGLAIQEDMRVLQLKMERSVTELRSQVNISLQNIVADIQELTRAVRAESQARIGLSEALDAYRAASLQTTTEFRAELDALTEKQASFGVASQDRNRILALERTMSEVRSLVTTKTSNTRGDVAMDIRSLSQQVSSECAARLELSKSMDAYRDANLRTTTELRAELDIALEKLARLESSRNYTLTENSFVGGDVNIAVKTVEVDRNIASKKNIGADSGFSFGTKERSGVEVFTNVRERASSPSSDKKYLLLKGESDEMWSLKK